VSAVGADGPHREGRPNAVDHVGRVVGRGDLHEGFSVDDVVAGHCDHVDEASGILRDPLELVEVDLLRIRRSRS